MSPRVRRLLPVLDWLPNYRRADLPGDLLAGVIVAIVLVPQGMAYALLAGLPPETGLYASLLPPVLYGLFGTGRALAVGPVAIISLMVASATADYAGDADAVSVALVLSASSGLMLVAMGAARLGFFVNFLSHPVISGFTSASAIVIAVGQLRHLLGLEISGGLDFPDELAASLLALPSANPATAVLGLASLGLLLWWRAPLLRLLRRLGMPDGAAGALT